MNRRESLRSLLLSSGALLTLPDWANGWSIEEVSRHHPTFTEEYQALLSAVADTIIPPGEAIGAIAVGVDKFLLKLFDQCYDIEVRENIRTQLDLMNTAAINKYKKAFTKCNQIERETTLLLFADGADQSAKDFFSLIKSETIRGFNTSREVLVTYHQYRLVPGHYYGCVDVKK